MIKKTIKFEDLNGNEVITDAYFNLSKFDIAKLDIEYEDVKFVDENGEVLNGTQAVIRDIIANPKGKKILAFIENLVQKSYGKRIDDVEFRKSEEILASFMATDAYSELILSFVDNTEELTNFISGIIPKKLLEEAQKINSAKLTVVE